MEDYPNQKVTAAEITDVMMTPVKWQVNTRGRFSDLQVEEKVFDKKVPVETEAGDDYSNQ